MPPIDPFAALVPSAQPDIVPGEGGQPTRITVRPQSDSPVDPFAALVPKAPTTAAGAFGRGMMTGATFNFYDELNGLAAAGGLDPNDPNIVNAVKALAVGGYKKIIGDPEAEKTFAAEVAKRRAETKQLEAEHPIASTAGNVAGAVALPLGGAVGGGSLAVRSARAAGLGGAVGGAYGLGEGEGGLVERVPEAAKGAAIGTVAGGASVPIVAAGQSALAKLREPFANIWRGFREPQAEAGRRVGIAVERDIRNVDQGLALPEYRAAEAAGQPVANIDIGGETTRALARDAANKNPEARAVLNRTIDNRFETQGGRLADWLRYRFNFPNAVAQEDALKSTARSTNAATYQRAYQDGAGGVWSPKLEQLSTSDAVGEAMKRAVPATRDEAVLVGVGGFNPKVSVTPDGRVVFNKGPTGAPIYPDLQYWDQVRRELSDAAQRAGRGTEEARRLSRFATEMNAELDRLVPSYQAARETAAGFFGASNALEAGQNFVGAGERLGLGQAQREMARMSPTERQLFQDGYTSRLIDLAEATKYRRTILGRLATSNAAKDELRLALGPQRADELEIWLRAEEVMERSRGAVQGNSTTVQQLVASGLGGAGGYGVATGDLNPGHLLTAAFVGGAVRHAGQRAVQRIDQGVARHVAELLTSTNPRDLSRGLQIARSRPGFLDALRQIDPALAGPAGRVGAEQGANVPALQMLGAGRAQDSQPEVPRPAGQ